MNVVWWRLRTSNPSKGGNVLGEFDSHTPPPFFYAMDRQDRPIIFKEAIICFENVSKAIAAEQILAKNKFDVKVMPTPASVREGCGFCLRFLPEELRQASAFLLEQGFAGTEAYMREESGGVASYKKVSFANGEDNETWS